MKVSRRAGKDNRAVFVVEIWGELHAAAKAIASAEGMTLRSVTSYLIIRGLQAYRDEGWTYLPHEQRERTRREELEQRRALSEIERSLDRFSLESGEE